MSIIDFHAHVFSDSIVERAMNALTSEVDITPALDGRLSAMAAVGRLARRRSDWMSSRGAAHRFPAAALPFRIDVSWPFGLLKMQLSGLARQDERFLSVEAGRSSPRRG